MANVLWIQTGACGGDTMSILCADKPSVESLVDFYNVNFLWQPSLSHQPVSYLEECIEKIEADELDLDVLCVEGSIILGPNGTGMYDAFLGKGKYKVIESLAAKAKFVVAMGTCASYGGVHASDPNPSECTGMQFEQTDQGGLFPPEWKSKSGLPVINVSGCPAHPNTMTQTLMTLVSRGEIDLDHLNRPKMFFSTLVHQGCTRNEYHEYDQEETEPGGRGCMFFNLGCQGPVTEAICNTDLWNGRSSKTRAGVPCFGCTSPDFPRDGDLFKTEKVGNIPKQLPSGVERANYMAYKNLAKNAAPKRVVDREMKP